MIQIGLDLSQILSLNKLRTQQQSLDFVVDYVKLVRHYDKPREVITDQRIFEPVQIMLDKANKLVLIAGFADETAVGLKPLQVNRFILFDLVEIN